MKSASNRSGLQVHRCLGTCPRYRLLCATSTVNSRKAEEVRNCLTDEGRPLGVGLQEQAPNHLRRLWPKATVVSAEGKGSDVTGSGDGQEEDRKGTTAEVSKVFRRCPKPRSYCCRGTKLRRHLLTGGAASGMRGGLSLP